MPLLRRRCRHNSMDHPSPVSSSFPELTFFLRFSFITKAVYLFFFIKPLCFTVHVVLRSSCIGFSSPHHRKNLRLTNTQSTSLCRNLTEPWCIFSRMGDIGGMKPIYVYVKWKVALKSKPSGSSIGHFQVASPWIQPLA